MESLAGSGPEIPIIIITGGGFRRDFTSKKKAE